ncbi:MAG: hypothetical protein IKQ91_11505 [Oscillospiraceae bacterium]|nr:hypothetical protein [Oscillospiraceae bacterium]
MAEKETEKKNNKKKKSSGVGRLIFLLILLLIAAVLFLLMHFGLLGFGGSGFGFRNSDSGSSVSSEADAASESEAEPAETTVEEKIYADVTVKESEYLYQNGTMTLDDLTAELEKLGADVTVRITDESAAKQAYDDLTAKLEEKKIAYEKAE